MPLEEQLFLEFPHPGGSVAALVGGAAADRPRRTRLQLQQAAVKILTVDGSSTTRRIIKNTLNRIGYTDVVEAEHGVDALAKMGGVELMITDWNMPEMDGLTFVKTLRSNPRYGQLPIIMVATEAAKKEILEAI